MKSTHFLLLLIVSLLWISCENKTGNDAGTTVPTSMKNLPEAFYKRYEGTIAGQPVIMHLHKDGQAFEGIYSYRNIGTWMNLSLDSLSTDTLYFSEYFSGDNWDENTSDQSAKLHCAIAGDNMKGVWFSKDGAKTYEIDLHEAYPDGSYEFTVQAYHDSVKAYDALKDSPEATSDYRFPVAKNGNAWLNQQIKRILGFDSTDLSVSFGDGIRKLSAQYLNNYKADLPDLKDTSEGWPLETLNYSQWENISVRYNDHDFIVLESGFYDYSGGAHGNYGSGLYCLDVKEQKQLELSDIITADSATLQPFVEKYFRIQYHIKADSLNEVLFDNYLAANDNFYITDKGLGFIYNPYEVASYAQGQINVLVPFKALDKYLVPSFRQRMGLH